MQQEQKQERFKLDMKTIRYFNKFQGIPHHLPFSIQKTHFKQNIELHAVLVCIMQDPQLDLNQHSLLALKVSQIQSTTTQANSLTDQHNAEIGS